MHSRSLYQRLFLPFVAALLAGTLSALLVTHLLYARLAFTQLESQLADTVEVLANAVFPLTPELMLTLSRLTGAGFLLRGEDGIESYGVDSAGLVGGDLSALLAADPEDGGAALEAGPYLVEADGGVFLALSRPLRRGAVAPYDSVTAVMDVSAWRSVFSRALLLLGVGALPAIALLAWVGHRISRSITLPVARLADMAQAIAEGDREVRADIRRHDEIGRLAEDLNRMAERLASYERDIAASSKAAARGEMAARLAHEIRNPLTAIKMQLELLRDIVEPAEIATLDDLLREVARLELIVSGTLSQGRAPRPVLEPTDLAAVTRDLADLLLPQLAHRHIRLRVCTEEDLPAAHADRGLVRQVLFNLLLNAADAMPEGGEVAVTVRGRDGRRGVEVLVDDAGPGIPAAKRAQIFSASATASSKPGGFGIGLTLSRELMEHQGGDIAYCAGELGGACFRLRFRADEGA